MKSYKEWIQERIESTIQKRKYYFAEYENKEVRVYSENDCVYVNWFIDGRLIKKSKFPKEIMEEMRWYIQGLYGKCIHEELLSNISCAIGKYLPYLEDEENLIGSLEHVEIVGKL